MMNENEEKIVALTEEELESVTGGKHSYIEGDDGKSHVRTGPGLGYKSLGVLHRGEDARYLHETSVDERGVVWYKIRWNGRDAWVLYPVRERVGSRTDYSSASVCLSARAPPGLPPA